MIDQLDLKAQVDEQTQVSCIATLAEHATAAYVFAHGAGAGMTHPFMSACALRLAQRRISTLRYQFPYMEQHSRRPDAPPRAHATVRAAVDLASQTFGPLRLFAGGKSFGARMTSQAQALQPLTGVAGLVFLGFPLHPARKPSTTRAEHLHDVDIPMLFFHGVRDALAEPGPFERVTKALGTAASVVDIPEADHGFHVPVRSGRNDDEMLDDIADRMAVWVQAWTL